MRSSLPNGFSELTLARIWQDGAYAREMRTTDGRRITVVYGGVWTCSNGPDFRDALIDLDGRLTRGAIELHLAASDWFRHGHQRDPAYDTVILHVVLADDLTGSIHGPGLRPVPSVNLSDFLTAPIDALARTMSQRPLGSLGIETCLPTLAGGQVPKIRDILQREGWRRLSGKQLQYAQTLEFLPPGEALFRGLLDALGYSNNRLGMARLGERLSLATLEAVSGGHSRLLSALLGAGGFLPVSPSHAAIAELDPEVVSAIEELWPMVSGDLKIHTPATPGWVLNRVRPVNHPARRLASLASLIDRAQPDGLFTSFLTQAQDDSGPWTRWLEAARPRIGKERIQQIMVNVLAPFLSAYADAIGDDTLAERAGQIWSMLPGAADDSIARMTLRQIVGQTRFPIRLAIEAQGLHRIGRHGCRELRCFDCPIAMLALEHEPGHALREDYDSVL